MSTSDAGRKPRTPRSMIRPPLTTSMTVPSTGLAALRRRLDAPPRLLEARALLGHDEAAVLVLLGEDQRVDLLAELDLVVRVDVLADRQLVGGDDPLALVADVDEDLVVVDATTRPETTSPSFERGRTWRRSSGRSGPSISSSRPSEPSTTLASTVGLVVWVMCGEG
jgi:hypothetical protein